MLIKKFIKTRLFIALAFILITSIFFNKTILKGYVPFPGDLLIAEYSPWKYESYLGYNPGSYPNKAQYFDTIRQIVPWRLLAIDEFKNGRMPYWNPYNFSGSPLLANNQSAVFYPLNFIFFIFKPPVAWTIFIFLQQLLCLVFTYLFARKIKMSKIPALFSSVAFSFSLFMIVFLEYGNFGHTVLWLPLILFFSEKLIKKITIFSAAGLTISVFISGLGGHIQLFSGVFIFSLIYILVRIVQAHRKKISAIVFLFLGLLMSSLQLIPTFELIQNSARVPHNIENYTQNLLIQINQLFLFLSPDMFGNPATRNYLLTDSYPGNSLYIGILPLFFVIVSLVIFKKSQFVRFFSLISLVLLFFITNNFLSQQIIKLNIPFLSSSSPSNYIFLLSFSLAIIAGIGMDNLKKITAKKQFLILFLLALLFIGGFLYHKLVGIEINQKQYFLSAILFAISSVSILFFYFLKKKIILLIMLAILVVDLFYYFQKFNPFVPNVLFYPKEEIATYLKNIQDYDRFWGYGPANIEPNFATQLRLFSVDGYDPLYPIWYGKFISLSYPESIDEFSFRSDALVKQGTGEKDLAENNNRLRILDVLGVKYFLDRMENGSSESTFPIDRFEMIYSENGWNVLKNIQSLPRAFTLNKECKSLLDDINCEINEEDIVLYNPTKVQINTGEGSNGILVLTDTYYPGWEVFIDGEKSRIKRVDNVFRGVNISGEHEVKFIFKPASFYLGVKATIISIALLFFMLLTIKFRLWKKL